MKISFIQHLASPFLICRFVFKTLLPTALDAVGLLKATQDGTPKRLFNTLPDIISRWKNPPNMRWTNKKKGNIGKQL